jgi:hypothetical protein
MYKIHILIVTDSPDFAKSLGYLILDVFGTRTTEIEYAYNLQDGLNQINQGEYHFIFISGNSDSNDFHENKQLFKEASLNPNVKIIKLSVSGSIGYEEVSNDTEKRNCLSKDEIDAEDFAYILEKMK